MVLGAVANIAIWWQKLLLPAQPIFGTVSECRGTLAAEFLEVSAEVTSVAEPEVGGDFLHSQKRADE